PECIAGLATGGLAPERYGDDAGTGSTNSGLHDRGRRIERTADQKAGGEGFAVEVHHCVSPPSFRTVREADRSGISKLSRKIPGSRLRRAPEWRCKTASRHLTLPVAA